LQRVCKLPQRFTEHLKSRGKKMIHELVYYSIANRDLTAADITDILNHSRRYNKENNITGCLLYYHNEFIQFLEGDSKSVKELYANITKDKRHSNIVLITEAEAEERLFNSWTMAFHTVNNQDINNIERTLFINNFLSFADFIDKPTMAIKLFLYHTKEMLLEK
jgi:hypothetical protein